MLRVDQSELADLLFRDLHTRKMDNDGRDNPCFPIVTRISSGQSDIRDLRSDGHPDPDCIIVEGISTADDHDDAWARTRSDLFDAGYVPLKFILEGVKTPHLLYARSDLLKDPAIATAIAQEYVSMRCLGSLGRFGNQLWQYLFLRMYGLRNGLIIKVPEWEGELVFGCSDARPENDNGYELPVFLVEGDDDLELWEIDDAPRNVDFKGFFQQVPQQWRVHQQFIRRTLTPRNGWKGAVERANAALEGRTLVTIHVRRGDYRITTSPMFRLVPIEWYHDLLDGIWSTLTRPVLHVSTDEPDAILPEFENYEKFDAEFFGRDFGMPDYIRDFVLLQQADYLVACNSSLSTMAAVTGKAQQQCYLVDFNAERFTPYDPWTEASFWARFLPESRTLERGGFGLRGARKRALMLRLSPMPKLEAEVERLRGRLQYLEGGAGPSSARWLHRVWRAVRCR